MQFLQILVLLNPHMRYVDFFLNKYYDCKVALNSHKVTKHTHIHCIYIGLQNTFIIYFFKKMPI